MHLRPQEKIGKLKKKKRKRKERKRILKKKSYIKVCLVVVNHIRLILINGLPTYHDLGCRSCVLPVKVTGSAVPAY